MDPIQEGKLLAEVEQLQKDVEQLGKDVKNLLALANQSKGGFWMGMSMAGSLGAVLSWAATHFPFGK